MPADSITPPATRPERATRAAIALAWAGALLVPAALLTAAAHQWAGHHTRAARVALAVFDPAAAQRHLGLADRTWPADPERRLMAARAARQLGQLSGARTHLDAFDRAGGAAREGALERALLQAREGGAAAQLADLRALVEGGHPDARGILDGLARGAFALGASGLCGELLDALEALPGLPDASPPARRFWQGLRAAAEGRHAPGIAALTEVVADCPGWVDARVLLAQVQYQAGDPAGALTQYRAAAELEPDHPAVLLGLGLALQDLADPDGAAAALDRLLALQPNHLPAAVERARVAWRRGQAGEAEARARVITQLAPYEPDGWLLLSLALAGPEADAARERWQGLDAAEQHLRKIPEMLAGAPDDPEVHHLQARLLVRLGRDEEGARAAERVLRLAAGHRGAHALLADLHDRQGRPDLAAPHRRKLDQP